MKFACSCIIDEERASQRESNKASFKIQKTSSIENLRRDHTFKSYYSLLNSLRFIRTMS